MSTIKTNLRRTGFHKTPLISDSKHIRQLGTDILKEAIANVRPINFGNGKSSTLGIKKDKTALKEQLFKKKKSNEKARPCTST